MTVPVAYINQKRSDIATEENVAKWNT